MASILFGIVTMWPCHGFMLTAKHAVRRHFSGIPDDVLVTSYFDKLIQVPIRVPPLGAQEVRA